MSGQRTDRGGIKDGGMFELGLPGDFILIRIPRSCVVEFDRKEVVKLKNGRDNCNKKFLRSHEVCVKNYYSRSDQIYACNVVIDQMDKDLEGEVERELLSDTHIFLHS